MSLEKLETMYHSINIDESKYLSNDLEFNVSRSFFAKCVQEHNEYIYGKKLSFFEVEEAIEEHLSNKKVLTYKGIPLKIV